MHCDFKRALRGSDIKLHRSSSPSCGCEQPCHPSLPLLLFLLSWKESPGQRPGCPWAHSGVGFCYPKWPHGRHLRCSLPRVMLVLNEEFSSVNGFGVQKTPEEEKGFGACLMLCSSEGCGQILRGRALAVVCRHCGQCSQLSQEFIPEAVECVTNTEQPVLQQVPRSPSGSSFGALLSQPARSPSCI